MEIGKKIVGITDFQRIRPFVFNFIVDHQITVIYTIPFIVFQEALNLSLFPFFFCDVVKCVP